MKKQTGSVEMVRHINTSLVLDLIRQKEPISRAQISKTLELSRSTVGLIVGWLLERELVFEDGTQAASGVGSGRPGQMLRFNPAAGHIVGVTLNRTETMVCLADLRGTITGRKALPAALDAEGIADRVRALCDQEGIDLSRVSCVSVSIPGIATREGKVRAKQLKWKNYDLYSELRRELQLPVYINNDVNLALIGERTFGIGRNCDDIVYLYLGKGIGCGVICGGRMVSGAASLAGEIGMSMLVSPLSASGEAVSLESLLGSEAFSAFPGGFEEMAYGYSRGEEKAAKATEVFLQALCLAMTNVIALLNPKMIILGGKTSTYMDDMLEEIQQRVEDLINIKTEIRLAVHRADASLLGAVAFALEHIGDEQEH